MKGDVSVFVASGDRLFGDVVRSVLERRPGWTCAGVAQDGIATLAAVARSTPDALLVTTRLERLGAAALAAQVRRRWPGLPIVLLGRVESDAARVLDPATPAEEVFAALEASPVARPDGVPSRRARELDLLRSLTKRERVVLKMIANGASLAEAARELGVSEHTVRTHVQNLYDKVDCHSRLDLVRFAERHGLIASAGAEP